MWLSIRILPSNLTRLQSLKSYIQFNEPVTTDEEETKQDEDSDDESYRPTTDSFDDSDKEETFDKEHPDENLQPGTKLVVFWSCIANRITNIPGIHSQMRMVGQLGAFQLPPQLVYLEELLKD